MQPLTLYNKVLLGSLGVLEGKIRPTLWHDIANFFLVKSEGAIISLDN